MSDDRPWDVYCGTYRYQGKVFPFYVEAQSFDDADARFEKIKENGEIDGRIGKMIDGSGTVLGMDKFLNTIKDVIDFEP